jgi:hypothetical protein
MDILLETAVVVNEIQEVEIQEVREIQEVQAVEEIQDVVKVDTKKYKGIDKLKHSRTCLTNDTCHIPPHIVAFFHDKIIRGGKYEYKHTTPYYTRKTFRGWMAQVKKPDGKFNYMGLFQHQYEAAIAVAAFYTDPLINLHYKTTKMWLKDVSKHPSRWDEWVSKTVF